MKVLVPIDVQSTYEIEAARRLIESNVWPADAEFHLLNVIEKAYPGAPCEQPECQPHCVCLEYRVRKLRELLARLNRERPELRIFMEVTTGNLRNIIAERLANEPSTQLLVARPISPLRPVASGRSQR